MAHRGRPRHTYPLVTFRQADGSIISARLDELHVLLREYDERPTIRRRAVILTPDAKVNRTLIQSAQLFYFPLK